MKTLALVLALALGLYLVRRRLKLALIVALGVYLPLSLWRLLQEEDQARYLLQAGVSLAILLAAWGVLWVAARALERHRASPRQRGKT